MTPPEPFANAETVSAMLLGSPPAASFTSTKRVSVPVLRAMPTNSPSWNVLRDAIKPTFSLMLCSATHRHPTVLEGRRAF